MQFHHNLRRRNADIKVYDSNHRQESTVEMKLRINDKKLMKEKTLELKKTIESKKQNIILQALITMKERETLKDGPIQRMETFRRDRVTDIPEITAIPDTDRVDTAMHQTGVPYTNFWHRNQIVTNAVRFNKNKERQRMNNNRTVRKITENEETSEPNERNKERIG